MITAQDLIRSTEPGYTGRLDLGLFPGYTLETFTAYIDALIVKAYQAPIVANAPPEKRDLLATAWVYAEAYDVAYTTALTRSSEMKLDNLGTKKLDVKGLRDGILFLRAPYAVLIDGTPPRRKYPRGSQSARVEVYPAGGPPDNV